VLKQALPYVRMVGPSWPLSTDRNRYEHQAYAVYSQIVPDLIPRIYHVNEAQALFIMEDLSRLIIARRGLVRQQPYPRLARDVARFAAETALRTSDFYLPSAAKKALVARFVTNTELCKITEDLVLTNPFFDAPDNSFEAELRPAVGEIWEDGRVQVAVERLRHAFMSRTEGLLHGDLHTGSVMAGADETRVVDAEFVLVGPFGFDIGMFMANLFLSALSHLVQSATAAQRAYGAWMQEQAEEAWLAFQHRVSDLLATAPVWTLLPASRAELVQQILREATGFAGAEMIRRTIGLARVADLEDIADRATRVRAKRAALYAGRALLTLGPGIDHFSQVLAALQQALDDSALPGTGA
jgi:5-methylthioribose kinase